MVPLEKALADAAAYPADRMLATCRSRKAQSILDDNENGSHDNRFSISADMLLFIAVFPCFSIGLDKKILVSPFFFPQAAGCDVNSTVQAKRYQPENSDLS